MWGRGVCAQLRLALDTGSASILVRPEVIERLGYTIRDAARYTTVESTNELERGYLIRVARVSALGHVMRAPMVHVFDLPPSWDDLDGLLGLSFLDHLNYEIRSKEGRILVERAA